MNSYIFRICINDPDMDAINISSYCTDDEESVRTGHVLCDLTLSVGYSNLLLEIFKNDHLLASMKEPGKEDEYLDRLVTYAINK